MNRKQEVMNNKKGITARMFFVFCFLFFSATFLLFFRLGSTTLTNWDEAWLASVSQDIAVRGDWLGGQWNGQTWFYEPPLVTWSLAVLYKIFGPSEFWLRSLNAVLGFLTIVVVSKLSALISKSAKSALISVIILLSDIEFLFRSRQINVEIPVTFFLVFTLYAAIKTLSSPQRKWWIVAGIFLGFAFLTKRASPMLIFPAILITVIKALSPLRREASRNLYKKNVILMIAVFFAIAAPWYFFSYLRFGNQFINEFFLGYTLGKIRSINPGAGTDIWFYITALRHSFKLWFPLIPLAIIWATVKSLRDQKIAILTILIWTFLIFLTLAPIKSSWFLLPAHPALAILTGLLVTDLVKFTKLHNRLRGLTNFSTVAVMMSIIIAAWQIWNYRYDFIVPNTTGHQAALAKLAGKLSSPDKSIYLDDDYLPVAVFYSQRRVIPLRFNRLQSITPLPVSPGSYILTNDETLSTLKSNYSNITLVNQISDLILVQNQP